jgi:hypothetical protein
MARGCGAVGGSCAVTLVAAVLVAAVALAVASPAESQAPPQMPSVATWYFQVFGANGQRGLAIEKYNRVLKVDRSDFVWERPFNGSRVVLPMFGGIDGSFAEGLVTENFTYTITTEDSGRQHCREFEIGDGGWFEADYFAQCKPLGLVERPGCLRGGSTSGAQELLLGYRCGYFGAFSSFFLQPDADPAVPCFIETADGLVSYQLLHWENDMNTTWPLDPSYAEVPAVCRPSRNTHTIH